MRGAPCRACCSLLPTRSIFGRSFGDAGCPVTEGRMLERLGCAAYGDSPSDRYKKSLTANVRRHEGSKNDFFDMKSRTMGGTVTYTQERNAWRVPGGDTRQASCGPTAMGDG